MSEKLTDKLRVGIVYFVKDVKIANNSLNMYYENLQAIIKNEGDSKPVFGIPLSDKLSALFLYIDQTMKGYDSYFLKVKRLNSNKDMIIFGKNHYSSLNMPTKGRLSIMLTKSIDNSEYPTMISGEEFPFLDKLLGKVIENGRFKHENNPDVGKYCYFEFEKNDEKEMGGQEKIIRFIDKFNFKPLFKKNELLLERSKLKFDSCWNLHIFSHADIIYSEKFVNGKSRDYYEKKFKNWEDFDTFQYLSLFVTCVDMYSQNELKLSHLVVNDRIVFFGKYEGKFDDKQEDSDLNHCVINILLEVSNRIDKQHNNFIKGFERDFVNDLEKEIDNFYKNNEFLICNPLLESNPLMEVVDVNKCETTKKEYLNDIKNKSIELASKNVPCSVPPINIKDAPIPFFVGNETKTRTVVDESLQKLADTIHCIVQPLLKKYFPN